MEAIISYFSDIPTLHRSLILITGLFFFYAIEYIIPYIKFNYRKEQHAAINILFTVTTVIVNFAFAFIMVTSSEYVTSQKIGLLYLTDLPTWVFMLLGLLILDLIGAWLIHYLQHKIKWMWKFHLIHHTDMHVDASTANRHHPGESVFRFFFTFLAVIVSGCPVWLLMLYQSLSVVLSQFNHANISLPGWLDKTIRLVIVSPDMHKVHHHYVQPYTDTNYANIFSFWDRLFGTYKTIEKSKLIYGVDTHMDTVTHTSVQRLMSLPFQPYKVAEGNKFYESENKFPSHDKQSLL